MKFFDYLFYKMKWWNTKVVTDFSPFYSSIIILAVFQGFNVLTVVNFIKFNWNYNIILIDKYFLLLPIVFFIFNYFYYRSPVKQANIEKWILTLTKKTKIINNICVILYLILSIVLLIWIGYNIRQQNI